MVLAPPGCLFLPQIAVALPPRLAKRELLTWPANTQTFIREGKREIEREREREKERERKRKGKIDREREKERERKGERKRERKRERKKERERERVVYLCMVGFFASSVVGEREINQNDDFYYY
jgi:transposase